MSYIPVSEPLLAGNEKRYIEDCLDTAWISSEGPYVQRLEEELAQKVRRNFGIAVCNGSAALELAIHMLGIGEGDEVILPTFTIISCIAPIIRAGAKPVLVDSYADTWNMDVGQVLSKITNRTKAIMAVHIYGLPVDMDPILEAANKRGIWVIEDAAEAIGLIYKDRPCGSMGQVSTFSFYPNKPITTGEGGMVLTNESGLAQRGRSLRNLCFQAERRFVHEELGWNFRMSNLQAALGVAQLENLHNTMERKKAIGERYAEQLCRHPGLQLPVHRTDYAENVFWVYGVVLQENVTLDATEAMTRLHQAGIGTRPFFWPLHQQPVCQRKGFFQNESYPVAERLGRRGFYLPSGLTVSASQIKRVCSVLKDILG